MIGLHAMVNEHFGIGIAEYMAAGLVPVANSSGGPLMDIVVPIDGEITGKVPFSYQDFWPVLKMNMCIVFIKF